MTTQLTEQERYELLLKQIEATKRIIEKIEDITKELEDTKNKLTNTADVVGSYNVLWSQSVKNYEKLDLDLKTSVEAIKKQIVDYKEETDRFKQYSKGIDENLEARLNNFNDKFDNFKGNLDTLQREIRSIREIDFNGINERIKELPSFEAIRQELSNSTSPLVTKTDFNSLENKVSKIEGSVGAHFRNNLISMFLTVIMIIGANVTMYLAMYRTIISSIKNTQQNSPTPGNLTIPSPSKPTP